MSKKPMNKINIIKLPDGQLAELLDDGTTRLLKDDTNWKKVKGLSEKGINKAASLDPDTSIPTPNQLKQFSRVVDAKKVRQDLKLSQKEFSEAFLIPKKTLQDWEQHRRKMDSTAKAYLSVIANNPDIVQHALHTDQ